MRKKWKPALAAALGFLFTVLLLSGCHGAMKRASFEVPDEQTNPMLF